MQRLFKFTKLKLIAGYVIILLLSLFAIGFIYRQTMSLTQKGDIEQLTQRKLFITSNTLAKLYEAEAISFAFTQTDSKKKFNAYMAIMEEIRQNIDTLKQLSTKKIQVLRLDTIDGLLAQRMENLKQLIYVKRYSIPEDFYTKAITEIEALRDSSIQAPNIVTKVITTQDSSYVKTERPGFFKRLFTKEKEDSVLQIKTNQHLLVDTIQTTTYPSTDSIINSLRNAWMEVQQQKKEIAERIYRGELAVIQTGQNITERIKYILNDLENEEINNTLHKLQQQQTVTHQITKTISWIAIIACILVILFVFLILNDISQSQRYRKKLEEAKLYTEKLLHNREKLMLTVTHDIKSPLSSIISYIELLNNTRLEERQHYFLQNMKGSAEHILHLANNMLDFSKLEAKQMEVNLIPYNPYRLLQEITDSFLPLAAQKQLELESHISKNLDSNYNGDPLKIRQIIVNILSNAVKYTRTGKISISAFYANTKNDSLVVVIKDTGPGMTDEEQKLIFKEFTRLSAQHNNGMEGTGLGLTITLQLVQLLGGTLTLDSQKGSGSTFTVRLPLQQAETTTPSAPEENMEKAVTPPDKTINILLVDDDKIQLELRETILQSTGIKCMACMDSRKAISLVEQGSFDMVISDIQMPNMDGFELVHQIRESSNTRVQQIPVIAMSGRDDIPESKYLEAGFTAFINKMASPSQIVEEINKLLGCNLQFHPIQQEKETDNKGYSLETIRIFADNDTTSIIQITEAFLQDCQNNFKQLQEQETNGEFDKVSQLAHKMLPMFKQFQIQDIVPLLLFLERMDTKETERERIKDIVNKIIEQGDSITRKIKEDISKMS